MAAPGVPAEVRSAIANLDPQLQTVLFLEANAALFRAEPTGWVPLAQGLVVLYSRVDQTFALCFPLAPLLMDHIVALDASQQRPDFLMLQSPLGSFCMSLPTNQIPLALWTLASPTPLQPKAPSATTTTAPALSLSPSSSPTPAIVPVAAPAAPAPVSAPVAIPALQPRQASSPPPAYSSGVLAGLIHSAPIATTATAATAPLAPLAPLHDEKPAEKPAAAKAPIGTAAPAATAAAAAATAPKTSAAPPTTTTTINTAAASIDKGDCEVAEYDRTLANLKRINTKIVDVHLGTLLTSVYELVGDSYGDPIAKGSCYLIELKPGSAARYNLFVMNQEGSKDVKVPISASSLIEEANGSLMIGNGDNVLNIYFHTPEHAACFADALRLLIASEATPSSTASAAAATASPARATSAVKTPKKAVASSASSTPASSSAIAASPAVASSPAAAESPKKESAKAAAVAPSSPSPVQKRTSASTTTTPTSKPTATTILAGTAPASTTPPLPVKGKVQTAATASTASAATTPQWLEFTAAQASAVAAVAASSLRNDSEAQTKAFAHGRDGNPVLSLQDFKEALRRMLNDDRACQQLFGAYCEQTLAR